MSAIIVLPRMNDGWLPPSPDPSVPPATAIVQAREAREKEEAALDHKRRMLDYEEGNAAHLASLRREKDALEDQLRQQVGKGGGGEGEGREGKGDAGWANYKEAEVCISAPSSPPNPYTPHSTPPLQISAAKRNLEDSSALAELEVASLRTQV